MRLLPDFFRTKNFGDNGNEVVSLFRNDDLLRARHIVRKELPRPLWGAGIRKCSNERVHVILCGVTPLAVAIARQVALLCHFPNFDENTGRNRTLITFLTDEDVSAEEVQSIGLTGNLTQCCRLVFTECGDGTPVVKECINPDSFLDVEMEFATLRGGTLARYVEHRCEASDIVTCFSCGVSDAQLFDGKTRQHFLLKETPLDSETRQRYLEEIDLTRAKLVNTVYNIGTGLREVSDFANLDARDYNMSLQRLCQEITRNSMEAAWQKLSADSDSAEMKLSNLYCGDCIDAKIASLGLARKNFVHPSSFSGFKCKLLRHKRRTSPRRILEQNLEVMARTEHSRWVVERLIQGYRPYTPEEHYSDELRCGKERIAHRKELKKKRKCHIDMCSYRDLRHIDPGVIKNDCFITLAIDFVLTRENRFRNRK